MKTDILNQKVTGAQFKGETLGYFIDRIIDYFLPKFNNPLVLTNSSNVLSENFRESYSDSSINWFLNDLSVYPNAEISIETKDRGRKFKTIIPKELNQYLAERLNQPK